MVKVFVSGGYVCMVTCLPGAFSKEGKPVPDSWFCVPEGQFSMLSGSEYTTVYADGRTHFVLATPGEILQAMPSQDNEHDPGNLYRSTAEADELMAKPFEVA